MTPSRIWGLAKQRYVKSHRIFAKCRCIKDFRRFRNSQVGDLFSRSVLGVDSDRILKLVLREIILSQKIQMPPGSRRAMGHREDQKKAATETRKLVEKSVGSWQHWAKRNQQVVYPRQKENASKMSVPARFPSNGLSAMPKEPKPLSLESTSKEPLWIVSKRC
jgi:hypothetical protein